MTYFPIWILFSKNKKNIKKDNVKKNTDIKDNDKVSVDIKNNT